MASTSLVASFRERQSAEEASARLGLSSPAVVASHEVMNARTTRGAARILHLVEQGKHAEAWICLNLPDWGQAEEEEGGVVETARM